MADENASYERITAYHGIFEPLHEYIPKEEGESLSLEGRIMLLMHFAGWFMYQMANQESDHARKAAFQTVGDQLQRLAQVPYPD